MKKRFLNIVLVLLAMSGNAISQELDIRGFTEAAYGFRAVDNNVIDTEYPLNEYRLQLKMSHSVDNGDFFAAVDFLSDRAVGLSNSVNLREAYFRFSPADAIEVKVGRQVLTWGAGDLVFINDVFPKDWVSLFTGRDDQYLKLASDALKISFYGSLMNLDIVYSPNFDSDNFSDPARLSFYNSNMDAIVGGNIGGGIMYPEHKFKNSELAVRGTRMFGNLVVSGYYYHGFYKTPEGFNTTLGMPYFPELDIYGGSVRGAYLNGVLSLEAGMYDSKDDSDGNNPMVTNGSFKYLVGYEKQLWTDFTMGVQYFGEKMSDYDAYKSTVMNSNTMMDETSHLFTTRMTQMLYYQNVNLSLFTFYNPTDEDFYIRPGVSFKYSDAITLSAGGNIFGGKHIHTMFGQFQDNTNVYFRMRYYF